MPERSPRTLLAVSAGLGMLVAACGTGAGSSTTSNPAASGSFPATLTVANGTVRIATQPRAIVSLSPTATEMLYAIGAGPQVKAVDKDSDYPRRAPHTTLDGFQPNVEAIVTYHPDLVVEAGDTGGLASQLGGLGIPVLSLPAATTLSDTYRQFGELGVATGHRSQAATEVASVRSQISQIVRDAPTGHRGQTYYYELDPTYFSVTSSTFIGRVLGLLGLRNIADSAPGVASSGGYPQLSSEFIVQSNPAFIFLADTLCCGQSSRTVAARPGWSTVKAVTTGQVVGLNDDIASRWGPRIVGLMRTVAAALSRHTGT